MKIRTVVEFKTEVECNAIKEIKENGEVKAKPWNRVFASLMKIDGEKTKLTKKCIFTTAAGKKNLSCENCLNDNSDLIKSEYYIDEFDRKVRWKIKNS